MEKMIKGFLAFMDHSITEQLIGDPAAWHTTAIALSEGGEVSDLARVISGGIFPEQPHLRKWSAGRPRGRRRYRQAFMREFASHLPQSKVLLCATSGTEASIVQARDQLVRDLRIPHLCTDIGPSPGPAHLRIGPFIHRETGEEHFFELPLNRALMAIWVAHFVARMHHMLRAQLAVNAEGDAILDWFFYHDKFAGDSVESSPSTGLFQTLVSGNIANGNVRSGFFVESDAVVADLLADNVAGLLNESRNTPESYPELPPLLQSGRMYYESSAPAA